MSKDTADGDEIDEAEQFDIDFTVMAGELAKLLDDIVAALGNQEQVQRAAAA
jgi:recombination associated protein RdgC